MSTIVFTKKTIPSAHWGKNADYPSLFTTKRFYKDSPLSEDEGLFINYGYTQNTLPFTAQDGYDHAEEPTDYDVVILENDLLKATFLPTLGGKLYSLYDKKNGCDLIVENPVVRPCNLSTRNAWTAGGVEWNCGIRGHHPMTCDKIFATSYTGADGTPVLRLYNFERVRAITYQMDFYLPDGSPFLLCRMRLVNGSDKPTPIYWWSNIAVHQEEGARVLVPTDEAYVNHMNDPMYKIGIPMVDGKDLSYPTNHEEAMDHFYKIPEDSRKFEAYIHKDGTGIIHASTRRLKGRKLFVWGMSVGGQNWQKFLTNEAGAAQPYVEIQAGLAYTQNENLMFPPRTAWEWVEAYGPVAMNPADVHGAYKESRVKVERWLDAKLPEQYLNDFLKQTKVDAVKPAAPVMFGYPWGTLDNIIRERLNDRPISPYLEFGPLGEEQQPWLRLLETGKMDEPDPKDAPVSFMIQDEWFDLMREAVKRADADNWSAWYHLGLCWFAREDYERAEDCFHKSLSLKANTWSYHALGNIAQWEGDYVKASKLLKQALDMNPGDITLAKESIRIAFAAKDYAMMKDIFNSIASENREDGLLQCYYAMALAHTGILEEAKDIFEKWGDRAVVDRREGADGITDAYIYVLREIAKRDGHPYEDCEDIEIPYHIDYRMHHIRMV